jgi:hypothetical protein
MTDAIADAWRAIRKQDPGVPHAAVSIVAGRGSGHEVVWDADTPVILVGAKTVSQGPEVILENLLHQAAHGLVGTHSVSSEGRYHSSTYRDAARSLGLQVAEVKGNGWARTNLTDELREVYDLQLRQLADSIDEWQMPDRPSPRRVVVHCQCDPVRRFTIVPSVLERGPISCEICGQRFAA